MEVKPRLLIIEDEESLAEVLCEFLRREFDVTYTKTGAEACEMLKSEHSFSAIICDLMLPDTTGMDIYEEAQKIQPGLEKKIIFMSGGAFTARAADFLNKIQNKQLLKPFKTAELIQVVKDSLEIRKYADVQNQISPGQL